MMIRISHVRWLSPVRVRIGYGFPETIGSPSEALGYLQYRWPAVDGDHCRQAKMLCAHAVQNPGLTDVAREAFLRACVEAKMLDEAPIQMPLTAR